MMNCVIVDDEPLAREGIARYVGEIDFLNLIATCENPVELMKVLDQHAIDLIFLDIQMPKMNGIDFLKMVKSPPMVIITTAFPSFALDGFQLNVLDYLVKPITFDRFFMAASKARDYHRLLAGNRESGRQNAEPKPDYFFVKCGSKYEKIQLADIIYVQGMQNYVTIYTSKGQYMTLLYLKNLEENLDENAFMRVHKSFIVSIDKIESIEGNEIFIQSIRIPISRNFRELVLEKVVNKKLLIK
jgi:two-component system, LytTR family, response regulator